LAENEVKAMRGLLRRVGINAKSVHTYPLDGSGIGIR
jgi:hypothetical protein